MTDLNKLMKLGPGDRGEAAKTEPATNIRIVADGQQPYEAATREPA